MFHLRSQLELLARDAAQLEKPDQRLLNQIVRTRCASGDSDDSRSIRQPEVRNDFAFLVQVVMLDFVSRSQARGIQHKISRKLFFSASSGPSRSTIACRTRRCTSSVSPRSIVV